MLDYRWWDWSGTVDDIDEARCDGVVEYSCEANGIRVCGGTDPQRWNIAVADTENVENHNDFHNHNYDPGELCPRIQAGGGEQDGWHSGAADTQLVSEIGSAPSVTGFIAYGWVWIFAPSIYFRISSDTYTRAFVRITVSKDGGPYYFVRTEDPYGGTNSQTGDWWFRTIPANTEERLFAWWMGKTLDGPDFFRQDGQFNFRMVAVDAGGNVSAERSTLITIHWPQPA